MYSYNKIFGRLENFCRSHNKSFLSMMTLIICVKVLVGKLKSIKMLYNSSIFHRIMFTWTIWFHFQFLWNKLQLKSRFNSSCNYLNFSNLSFYRFIDLVINFKLFNFFRCYSYDYGDTGFNVCRLSHQASSTLYLIDEPYIRSETAVTYERGSCYNVTIECQVPKLFKWHLGLE